MNRGRRFHAVVRRRGRWVVRILLSYQGIPIRWNRSMRT